MELREWQYMNKPAGSTTNNSSSSGYKKRFEKLIKYHIDHASSELESITRKDIFKYSFRFSEHYSHAARPDGYDRDIIVSIDHAADTFYLSVFIDHKQVENNNRIGWENFLKLLDNFMWLPNSGTSEYDDLLTESLNEWKLMNPPKAAQPVSNSNTNYPSQEDRYKKLLAQIDADGLFRKYHVNLLDDRILAVTLGNGIGVKIIFKPYVPCYLVQINGEDTACDTYEDVLKLLILEGIIGDTNLCESVSSIADDFKFYDFLWD